MMKRAMRLRHPPALYEKGYAWLVFLAALDVMMTWVVLWRGGVEFNPLAEAVIARFDVAGLAMFKFLVVAAVIGLCEVIGRRRWSAGRALVQFGIILHCIPIALAFVLLMTHLR